MCYYLPRVYHCHNALLCMRHVAAHLSITLCHMALLVPYVSPCITGAPLDTRCISTVIRITAMVLHIDTIAPHRNHIETNAMHIIKHRSRRTSDALTARYYWVVGGNISCATIEEAVTILIQLVDELGKTPIGMGDVLQ